MKQERWWQIRQGREAVENFLDPNCVNLFLEYVSEMHFSLKYDTSIVSDIDHM